MGRVVKSVAYAVMEPRMPQQSDEVKADAPFTAVISSGRVALPTFPLAWAGKRQERERDHRERVSWREYITRLSHFLGAGWNVDLGQPVHLCLDMYLCSLGFGERMAQV